MITHFFTVNFEKLQPKILNITTIQTYSNPSLNSKNPNKTINANPSLNSKNPNKIANVNPLLVLLSIIFN